MLTVSTCCLALSRALSLNAIFPNKSSSFCQLSQAEVLAK